MQLIYLFQIRKAERERQYALEREKVTQNLDKLLEEAERDEVARTAGGVSEKVVATK